ncbi:MAG: hypothetical protein F4Y14_10530 [Acidobacteria bacterium]|nr:hypothetical protein [Acidobacteriota bacterium]
MANPAASSGAGFTTDSRRAPGGSRSTDNHGQHENAAGLARRPASESAPFLKRDPTREEVLERLVR